MQCVDAETLAAWADGGLPKSEAAAVELHLSECDRCTAMLATFVRTTPEVPAAESLWSRWHLRWLVPVATATTVAALWVLTPRPDSVPATISDSDVATQAQAPTPPEPPAAADTKEQRLADAGPELGRLGAVAKREEASTPPPEQLQTRDEARQDLRVAEERAAAPAPAPRRVKPIEPIKKSFPSRAWRSLPLLPLPLPLPRRDVRPRRRLQPRHRVPELCDKQTRRDSPPWSRSWRSSPPIP